MVKNDKLYGQKRQIGWSKTTNWMVKNDKLDGQKRTLTSFKTTFWMVKTTNWVLLNYKLGTLKLQIGYSLNYKLGTLKLQITGFNDYAQVFFSFSSFSCVILSPKIFIPSFP